MILPEGEARDLYVVGGRITYVPQPGAETQTRGWIVPGLVDAHCHIGLGPHGAIPADEAEVQAIKDRDGGALVLRDCGSASDTRWIDDRSDLPHVIRAGRHIARTNRYMRGYADEVGPEDLVAAVRTQAVRGDGWVKLVGDWIDRDAGDLKPSWDASDFAAAITAAHDLGAKVTAHCFGTDVLPGLIAAGIDCIEHGTGLTPDLVDLMVSHGTSLVPTVAQIGLFPSLASAAGAKFPAYATTMTSLYEGRREAVMSAYEAGVPLYAGSDGANQRGHGTLHLEVAAMHAVGMSAEYALGAASWRAREWLGFNPTLTEGAPADFVVYDRNPLDDLSVLATPAAVVLRGTRVG
ncbi:amidohydrolase [Nocardioides baekrokdamisoli]|uniref:Amidohydrolase n=1 Tax=Nocardioides baekrokdamisoli TaxID=1804624 RepID=A0A3G9IGM6_9ACTN|nr:amidohydrolase [Nocardioides baekrokdamisoli]